ncbi:MAG: FAD-binding protein [Caldilineaceae bacterium]|nr:FAD-binding protein [Caldilineaceae bacterium]
MAEAGGIIVQTSRLGRLHEVDEVGRTALVDVGMVNQALDSRVKKSGLYFPPDPSSGRSAVIGGNIGTNAGGPHCFKYGVTTNYVMGLEVVLADGRIVQLGGQVVDMPEYDFCGLMVGSEGTLGLITRARLRLIRNPTGVQTMMVSFDSETQAGVAVSAVIAAGLVPATLEMMDQRTMRMIEEYVPAGLPVDAGAALIVEVDGYPEGLDTQIEEMADILSAHGGYALRIARDEAERAQIWYGRKSAAGAFSRISPGYYLTDVTVPRSRLGEILGEINAICARFDLRTANVFHAGDGNLHPLILCDPADDELMERVHHAAQEIIELSIGYDGSITGEHGVGMEKRKYMATMYSGAELLAMAEIKQVFDPDGLLNPGKVLPTEVPRVERFQRWLPNEEHFAPSTASEAAGLLAALTMHRKTVYVSSHGQRRANADVLLATTNLTGVTKFATRRPSL